MASIRKRTWESGGKKKTVWIADYFDQAGKRHIKTFIRKGDADEWLGQTKVEVKQGVHTPANKSITVAEAGEAWIEQAETDGLERSTVCQYRQHLDFHIKPFIGSIKLAELAPASVPTFRNQLLKADRSHVMAKKAVGSLGAILADAMAKGKVARNVVREQPKQNAKRQLRLDQRHKRQIEEGVDFPTMDETRAILAAAKGHWRPLIITAIFTGLRASELRGLTWDDVDLKRGVLTVRQRADRWNKIGAPKSDSAKREIPLAPLVANTLKTWKLAYPQAWTLGLVFPNGKGKIENLPNLYRFLGRLQFDVGITTAAAAMEQNPELSEKEAEGHAKSHPKYGLHAFRHFAASLFIDQGFSPKRVQTLMGHSTIQVTFDTYGHKFKSPDGDKAAMEQMQARLIG